MAGLSRDQIEQIKRELDNKGALPEWLVQSIGDDSRAAQRQKLESLSVLAGGIAHDFNNLLMGVLGHADLALRSLPRDVPARAQLGKIVSAARRSAELCQQLLAYSGKANFDVEPLDLREFIEEMDGLLRASISSRATLDFSSSENFKAPVEAEGSLLRQVVLNLVVNASESLDGEEGSLRLELSERHLGAEELAHAVIGDDLPEGRYAVLRVVDSGCGMALSTQMRCFDPFFTTKVKGRGLGLAVVLGIVRGHGGAITVETSVGEGSTFSVYLPVLDRTGGEATEATDSPEPFQGTGTVLVVDDEPNARRIAQLFLEEVGFEVLVAEDGQQAIEVFQLRSDDVVAVVLDLTMPKMGGEETFRRLRQIRDDVPVILSSGYSEQEVISRFAGEPWAGFIQKPYRFAALVHKLRELL